MSRPYILGRDMEPGHDRVGKTMPGRTGTAPLALTRPNRGVYTIRTCARKKTYVPTDLSSSKKKKKALGNWGVTSQPTNFYTDSDFSGYTSSQRIHRPFRLIPDKVPQQTLISPIYLHNVPPMTLFILFPEEYGPVHKDV